MLVRVGKETITSAMVEARLADLPDQYKAQYSTPTGRQQLLDRMVEEKVWLDVAMKNGVARSSQGPRSSSSSSAAIC